MQDRWDSGHEGCRTGGLPYRSDAGLRNIGQTGGKVGSKTGRKEGMQEK